MKSSHFATRAVTAAMSWPSVYVLDDGNVRVLKLAPERQSV
jgi:hypothetical protein